MIPKISTVKVTQRQRYRRFSFRSTDKSNTDVINFQRQSYDNASNVSGTCKIMQTERKKDSMYTDYCQCAAHSLNLMESQPPLVLNLLISFDY